MADTRPIPVHTQELILTYARRGWSVPKIARALVLDWYTVARCLDGWGMERRRRGRG